MQFKVPQNIDMEDKIIGPLTLTQFFYLLFGGIITYLLFKYMATSGLFGLFVVIAIPINLISLSFAFVKIQNRPFSAFVFAAFNYLGKPRQRIWKHIDRTSANSTKPVEHNDEKSRIAHKNIDISKVEDVAGILDKGGSNGETKN